MVIGVLLVLIEIVVRSVFNGTIYITQEYTGYLMVAITMFGLAYTLKEKGHIRLSFLHNAIKSPRGKAILDVYACICGLIIFSIITYATFDFFFNSFQSGSRSMQISKTYLFIPQFMLPLGSFILSLQFVAELIKLSEQLRTGEFEIEANDDQLGR